MIGWSFFSPAHPTDFFGVCVISFNSLVSICVKEILSNMVKNAAGKHHPPYL
jgi:hypothetical protein